MTNNKDWFEDEGEAKQESDFYKMKVGDNKVRVLTQFERVDQLFEGEYPNGKYAGMVDEEYRAKGSEKVSTQGWAWGVDRETGGVKIMQFGRGILKLIAGLRASDEYAFNEYPMPYDITIKNTGEGPARYSIVAARKNTEITEDEQVELDKKTAISDIIKKIKEKGGNTDNKAENKAEAGTYPQPEGDIAF